MIVTTETVLKARIMQSGPVWHVPAEMLETRFLSFQDALHYLVKLQKRAGQKILLPAFYCDATIRDMEKHGLKPILCPLDHTRFDVDVQQFRNILAQEKPGIIVAYDFLGKKSTLYEDLEWLANCDSNTLIISDYAHGLLPLRKPEFLSDNHVYIDSARKTVSCMMSHLITPSDFPHDPKLVTQHSLFQLYVRGLFALKMLFLKFALTTNCNALVRASMAVYSLHDDLIGSKSQAYAAFSFDAKRFNRIDFKAIGHHRDALFAVYRSSLTKLAAAGYIALFDIVDDERSKICFFFIRVLNIDKIETLISYLAIKGLWIDRLWNFDAVQGIDEAERAWCKSIVVLPYTINMSYTHIKVLAKEMEIFFAYNE